MVSYVAAVNSAAYAGIPNMCTTSCKLRINNNPHFVSVIKILIELNRDLYLASYVLIKG